ncbi:beta-ketoacyl synthase N-terminal-like domain-containing protein, partial [Streptomyces mesophilus]|uniref:beta-ketoacyl synthase N-terminal-like domain-containing protein n=1 Tax=Streptomyces mesophilus TaxID=1775132 RepID=UPI00332815F4
MSAFDPVAIVGMACRFPGAGNVEQFWANLHEGKEGLRRLTEEEMRSAAVREDLLRDPRYVPVIGDIADVDRFDAAFFGMTPREATLCDPQLRLFLETAHAAVENAGYDVTAVRDVAVYAAAGRNHYARNAPGTAPGADLQAGVFNQPDSLATLVSYKLNFTGPSMTVLTACSSSLLALHLAVQSLLSGECEMALIGGVEIERPGHGYLWSSGSPYSQDGRCRPFDAAASGTVFASGVGAVALKRLSDAVRDGDEVRALIRSTAANNDGSDKVGFTAPSVSGQSRVIMEALALAEAEPEDIGYVEAHGTGTPIGDPIEFTALTEAFRGAAGGRGLPAGYCGLGSVKSSIGHLGHAAGVASLIKAALCLEHEVLAPTLHLDEPSPKLDLPASPFYLVDRARPWARSIDRPRLAGVSALGFGGTNVHAVLEEAPPRPTPPQLAERPRLVVWSGATEEAEAAGRSVLAGHLGRCGAEEFADVTATLREGRTEHPVRAAIVAETAEEAAAA